MKEKELQKNISELKQIEMKGFGEFGPGCISISPVNNLTDEEAIAGWWDLQNSDDDEIHFEKEDVVFEFCEDDKNERWLIAKLSPELDSRIKERFNEERFSKNIDVLESDVVGHDDFGPCEIAFLFANKDDDFEKRVCRWIDDRRETFGIESFPFERDDLTFDVVDEAEKATLIVKIKQEIADTIVKIANKQKKDCNDAVLM